MENSDSQQAICQEICQFTGAQSARRGLVLQQLCSGYGEIVRYHLVGCDVPSVVVKQIALPEELAHPRGWHTDTGHQRKLRSYAVEAEWYRAYAKLCGPTCRVAHCYGVRGAGVGSAMVLQDLDAAGYALRLQRGDARSVQAVLSWLASFHAQWLGATAADLWPRGSYWHLATRPDELAAMPDGALKARASALDKALATARFQTLIHGDAKIANFCFSDDHQQLAAVDFQYVGKGVGVVDLAYFLGSCLGESELQEQAEHWLDSYLQCLSAALLERAELDAVQVQELLGEWRDLYPIAWADFERFLQGWSPGHPKLHGYSAVQTRLALARLA